jgi:hypothetical protein
MNKMSKNPVTKFYNYFFPNYPNTEKTKENEHKSRTYLLTIQILFGIIIGISFTDYYKKLVPRFIENSRICKICSVFYYS